MNWSKKAIYNYIIQIKKNIEKNICIIEKKATTNNILLFQNCVKM
jgi:hypothetical protein